MQVNIFYLIILFYFWQNSFYFKFIYLSNCHILLLGQSLPFKFFLIFFQILPAPRPLNFFYQNYFKLWCFYSTLLVASAQLTDNVRQPKKLRNTRDTILGSSKSKPLPNNLPLSQDFLDYFNKKVEAVCKKTGQVPVTTFFPPASATFSSF